jgi:hypothetical protein
MSEVSQLLKDPHVARMIQYIAIMGKARYSDLRKEFVESGLIPCATFHKRLKQMLEAGLLNKEKMGKASIFCLAGPFVKYLLGYSKYRKRFEEVKDDINGIEQLIHEACSEIASTLAKGTMEYVKRECYDDAVAAWLMAESLYAELLDLINEWLKHKQ